MRYYILLLFCSPPVVTSERYRFIFFLVLNEIGNYTVFIFEVNKTRFRLACLFEILRVISITNHIQDDSPRMITPFFTLIENLIFGIFKNNIFKLLRFFTLLTKCPVVIHSYYSTTTNCKKLKT